MDHFIIAQYFTFLFPSIATIFIIVSGSYAGILLFGSYGSDIADYARFVLWLHHRWFDMNLHNLKNALLK